MVEYDTATGSDTQERARFFPRQIVLPADLELDQLYFRNAARRDRRVRKEFGIHLGLELRRLTPERVKMLVENTTLPAGKDLETIWLEITPGYAVTPKGDVIYLPKSIYVNTQDEIDHALVTNESRCHSQAAERKDRAGKTLYLVVEASESKAHPVRAAGNRCGDHPEQFEYSRMKDTIRLRLIEGPIEMPYGKLEDEEVRRLIGDPTRDFVCLGNIVFGGQREWAVDVIKRDKRDKPAMPTQEPGPVLMPTPIRALPITPSFDETMIAILFWSGSALLAVIAAVYFMRSCGIV